MTRTYALIAGPLLAALIFGTLALLEQAHRAIAARAWRRRVSASLALWELLVSAGVVVACIYQGIQMGSNAQDQRDQNVMCCTVLVCSRV